MACGLGVDAARVYEMPVSSRAEAVGPRACRPRMSTRCQQCGEITRLRRGRCAACGAAVSVGEVVAHERRAALLRVVGEEWFWWVGEIVALTLIALVVADVLPIWTLAVSAVMLLRPLSRLLVLLVRGALDAPPG